MYTVEEVKKIIDDYKNLCESTKSNSLVYNTIDDLPITYNDNEVKVNVHSYDLGGGIDYDIETVPIEYFSMTEEEIEEDKIRRIEDARKLAEEQKLRDEEYVAKLKEEQEKRLLAELKLKYESKKETDEENS